MSVAKKTQEENAHSGNRVKKGEAFFDAKNFYQ